MSNFNKAFNFRGGFQVDTDVLVVRGQSVGIGSTIPTESLDVRGIIKADGLDITSKQAVGIETANVGFLSATLIHSGVTSISNGIITSTSTAGVVTYYGDGAQLLNLPTSQWLDIDVGLGFTSIYAQGFVGVDTNDPRFPFQVGGVPFEPGIGTNTIQYQEGVAIGYGQVQASGVITTRSYVSAASSVYTGGDFVGVGSLITLINADNIAIGSIGSMRYGDLIVTKEVIADNFTGIASTAVSVLPDSTLEFDTARANEITAVSRFISTEGKLVIGHNDADVSVGDIDVRKDGGDSYIYSLAGETSTGKIFAGKDREGGGRNSFGGIRFGGNVSGSPLSQREDLDIANYDIGNLNFYLHDGAPGSGTQGVFQWVYGQSNRVLADLTPEGKFSLDGNSTPNRTTFSVTGISSLSGDTYVNADLYVAGNANFATDLTVDGVLSFSEVNVTDDINLTGATFSGDVIFGNPPTSGSGVLIEPDGSITINGTITFFSGGQIRTTITESSISTPGTIFATGNIASGSEVRGSSIVATSDITAPNFSVDGISGLSATEANITNLTVGNSLEVIGNTNIANVTTGNITADNITADTANISVFTTSTDFATDVDIAGTLDTNNVNVRGDLDVSGQVDLQNAEVQGTITLNQIQPISGVSSVTLAGDLEVGGDLTVSGEFKPTSLDVSNDVNVAGIVSTSELVVSNPIVSQDDTIQLGPNQFGFVYSDIGGTKTLSVEVKDTLGNILATFDLTA